MDSLPDGFRALVIGSSGGIGTAVSKHLKETKNCGHVELVERTNSRSFDLTEEESIAKLYLDLKGNYGLFHLIFDATGVLKIDGEGPEKSLAALDPRRMAKAFAINTIGPALLFKHFAELLPHDGRSFFTTLSARVGSIEDNQLGGWYSYRASKAALNQIVRTAAIEIARKRPSVVCLALHPGTVETKLSRPFSSNRYTHAPFEAAQRLLDVIDNATPEQSGAFLAYDGSSLDW